MSLVSPVFYTAVTVKIGLNMVNTILLLLIFIMNFTARITGIRSTEIGNETPL